MKKKNPPSNPRRRERRPDGRIILVTGSTGAGKTAWTMQQVAHEPRLLVWDAKAEWGARERCRVLDGSNAFEKLIAATIPLQPGRIAYRVPVSRESFDLFCRAAWIWCRAGVGALIVEELADVTPPGKAPPAWGEIVRKSRSVGTTVYALTQRPAESDKTVVGNAAVMHCGLMAFADDRRYMARCLDVPEAKVAALGRLQYIERDLRARTLAHGKVEFRRRNRA